MSEQRTGHVIFFDKMLPTCFDENECKKFILIKSLLPKNGIKCVNSSNEYIIYTRSIRLGLSLYFNICFSANDSILPTLKEKIDKDGGESITCESPVTGEKRKNDTEVLTSNKKLAQSQSK